LRNGSGLAGTIVIEGSSTVEPIAIKAKEEFNRLHPRVNVSVNGKGTSNGISALIKGEADIANASRPIKQIEFRKATQVGRTFFEIPIAYDGLTFVVNRANTFVDHLTIEQLTRIFREDHAAQTWSEIDPSWPNEPITIYAPGIASGTHDCFVDVIGREANKGMRSDERITLSEDDKLLVRGVKEDRYSIGFFGYAYYLAEKDALRVIKIVNEDGIAVEPNRETILTGVYSPFGRPLFLYVSAESYQRVEVREFIDLHLAHAAECVEKAGFVPLPSEIYLRCLDRLDAGQQGMGTHYISAEGVRRVGLLADVYQQEHLRKE
jgi:phosphate transport system substrate-binding protein